MALRAVILLVLSILHNCCPQRHIQPDNGLNKCRSTANPLLTLEVLPGGGWDNLRNLDMGRVMNLSYSHCQTSDDGIYLTPDEVFIIPQKVTRVETNSEIISSWLEQCSSTSSSINADISFLSALNAKFSTENQRMKTHQVRDKSTTIRVQVRNLLYTVKTYPDFTLDSRFAGQAEDIAEAIENNQTRQAAYLSEKMVLDYGTHVLTSVDAGASLVQEDYLHASYVPDSVKGKSSITASARLNFNIVQFGIGIKTANDTSEIRNYQGNITYTIAESHGGVPLYPGITLQKWQESTRNNLVAIDRAGQPLHDFINHKTFPDLPEPTVGKLALSVKKAIERYYTINTRPGCVKVDSKNFNFQANVDDGSCEGPATKLSFGGVYQQCTNLTSDADPLCQAQAQKNPDTGSFSCRPPYQPTLLRSEVINETYSQYTCQKSCYSCWRIIQECCDSNCGDKFYVRSARIDTYWCSTNGKTQEQSGYLFGGLYGPSLQNPLTKSKNCPPNFIPLKLFSKGLMICVSGDYETGTRFSVPFGGLFSCQSTNPLAGGQHRCPPQFSQRVATVSDGCQVLYCVQSGLFNGWQLLPVQLPPFTHDPRLHPESDEMSGRVKFGIAFGVIGPLVVVGVVLVWRWGRRGFEQGEEYGRL